MMVQLQLQFTLQVVVSTVDKLIMDLIGSILDLRLGTFLTMAHTQEHRVGGQLQQPGA